MKSALIVLVGLFVAACETAHRPSEVAVAAAANLTQIAPDLGKRFEAKTGIHAVFSFASTAQLTQQIENGAPFDVLLAADASHVKELEDRKLLAPAGRSPYAIGVLALWVPSAPDIARIEDLASPAVRVISLAKPELAPYGQAAVETLKRTGLWDQVHSKIVYAENINMARQYGISGNADAVFTAKSLLSLDSGRVIAVDEKLHQPIVQELGILASAPHPAAAGKFTDFMLRGEGRAVLESAGYRLP